MNGFRMGTDTEHHLMGSYLIYIDAMITFLESGSNIVGLPESILLCFKAVSE